MPLITVVSGTFNRLPLLRDMIESARAAVPLGIALDFVIVDGGSEDGTLEWLSDQRDVTLIAHGELRGAINAFTEGAHTAQGKYVVLSNDDVTFYPGSLLKAMVYLEMTPDCGAVAFADNRPVPPWYEDDTKWHVLTTPGIRSGKETNLPYAQVGMFRKWLGDHLNWWRGNDERFAEARTYAGDNLLSSNIWSMGYTIDGVEGCRVNDLVHEDELRRINRGSAGEWMASDDSKLYYQIYPKGVTVPPKPQIPNPDKRALRILYLPIYESSPVQHQQKHGLRDALAKVGWVWEVDYQNTPRNELRRVLLNVLDTFQPDMVLSQMHGPEDIGKDLLLSLRNHCPGMVWVNWCGDTHRHSYINPPMLELLKNVDLQLGVNESVRPTMQANGIPYGYWQNSFEAPGLPLPDVPKYDVVMLATAYSDERKRLGKLLRDTLGDKFGLYGDWWGEVGDGTCLYDFTLGEALYTTAKVSIANNDYPEDYKFISNRIWQAIAPGGALFLQQHVPGLHELGLESGKHYVEWSDFDDLLEKINYWLDPKNEKKRRKIAKDGAAFVREHHSFDARVRELFVGIDGKPALMALALKQPRFIVSLRYIGPVTDQFGVMGKYTCIPGQALHVAPEDADRILDREPHLWRKVDTRESRVVEI